MPSWRDTLVRRRASQMSVFATSRLRQALVRQGRRSWATSISHHNMSACSKSLHGISSASICITDSTVLQPPITLLIHAHYHHRFAKFVLQPWSAPQTNVRLKRCFVNAASHECRPFRMTSQWQALTNQTPPFHTRYFCNTYEKFHGTFHTCVNSYVYEFMRVSKRVIPSGQRQAIIIWTTAVIVLIDPLGTNVSEI